MPNHCHNRVEIYGEPEEIKKIKNQLKTAETDFDFDTVIPTPNFNKIPTAFYDEPGMEVAGYL